MADDGSKAAEITASGNDSLIISVASAVYDQDKQLASIKLTDAFSKRQAIRAYDGDDITLTYKKHTDTKPDDCPKIDVSLADIERSINYLFNSVELTLAKVSQDQADLIEQAQCFRIDTDTAHTITNPGWTPPKI